MIADVYHYVSVFNKPATKCQWTDIRGGPHHSHLSVRDPSGANPIIQSVKTAIRGGLHHPYLSLREDTQKHLWLVRASLFGVTFFTFDRWPRSTTTHSGCVPRCVPRCVRRHILGVYLGVYQFKFRTVKYSLDAAKRDYYRAFNNILGKSDILHPRKWFSDWCTLIILWGFEVLHIRQSQLRSIDFMINRLFMKLFKTDDIRLVHLCQDLFHFHLPSVTLL